MVSNGKKFMNLEMPSCQALIAGTVHQQSGNFSEHHTRYGFVIPDGSCTKRKLFADEMPNVNPSKWPTNTPQPRNELKIKREKSPVQEFPKRIILGNGISQIAVHKKYNDSPTGLNSEVFVLNGNWDTSHSIPNIVAEMHNVNLAELQSSWGDESLTTMPTTTTTVVTATSTDQQNSSSLTLSGKSTTTTANSANNRAEGHNNGGKDATGNQDFISDDNFSWLVNFKLDDLIHASTPTSSSEYVANSRTNTQTSVQNSMPTVRPINMQVPNYNQQVYIADVNSLTNQYFTQSQLKNIIHENKQSLSTPIVALKTAKSLTASSINPPTRHTGPRKPPFTYTELIEHALREKGELTVSGIYQWISDHFPFYKANDDRWKNSVRHNLSINPHFRKGSKAVHGAGHLWTIAQKDDRKMSTWIMKKQRMQQFMEKYDDQEKAMEDELQAATASILPDVEYQQTEVPIQNNIQRIISNGIRNIEGQGNNTKREIEVQYVIPIGDSMDFMCPVSKEQVAEECGLQSCNDKDGKTHTELASGDYLITDLNPQTLGLNLSEAEIVTPDQLFGEDLNFQCYELQV